MMNYDQTVAYLFEQLPMYQRTGAAAYKANLDNTVALDRLTGHPHMRYRCIHVAGTNGKGSVSHMLASVLQEAGYNTGLYTSPHLLDFRERIRINGQVISKDYVTDFVRNVLPSIASLQPSFFELTVAMAFAYFRDMKVDLAVIETGMGGRLDSTNIITPEIAVITNISLDHTQFLGTNVASIAGEKAGIIKEGIPVVIGKTVPEALKVFKRVASERNAPLYPAGDVRVFDHQIHLPSGASRFYYREANGQSMMVETDLSGQYQSENILTALRTLEILDEGTVDITQRARDSGFRNIISNTGLRGRWETIGTHPRIICDTAHNPAGIAMVMDQLMHVPARKKHIIWGMVNDKTIQDVIPLLPKDASYTFTRASVPRSMDPALMEEAAKHAGLEYETKGSVGEAIEQVMKRSDAGDVIYIGGSTFVVADALQFVPKSS
jgi:dihydrofolate synthase/folylpolyglutamate synthase